MIRFLKEYKDEKRKEEPEKMSLSQKITKRKCHNELIPTHSNKKGRLKT